MLFLYFVEYFLTSTVSLFAPSREENPKDRKITNIFEYNETVAMSAIKNNIIIISKNLSNFLENASNINTKYEK